MMNTSRPPPEEAGAHTDALPALRICAACLAGPFSQDAFREAISDFHSTTDTGYCYTIKWSDIAKTGCEWCSLVRRTKDGLPASNFPRDSKENVEIRYQITIQQPQDWTEVENTLRIFINGYKAALYSIYADTGKSSPDYNTTGCRSEHNLFQIT